MKKILFKSVIFKLLASIVLIILPINVLMLISSRMLVASTKKHIFSEMENSLNVYMDKLDQEIHGTEAFLVKLKNNTHYLRVVSGMMDVGEQYDYMRECCLSREIGTMRQ